MRRYPARMTQPAFRLTHATPADRERIYVARHAVYASELSQHRENADGRLMDALDARNDYLCVWSGASLAGFVSITAPGGAYSMDKYLARTAWPFPCDDGLYEVRLLTVMPEARRRELALLLMYGALRWIESRGGTRVMAIGRREVMGLYEKAGLVPTGQTAVSGAVTFDVMTATVEALRARAEAIAPMIARIEAATAWELDIAFRRPAPCFHGGTFFEAIGPQFDALDRRHDVINADVLDAWFPPSPRALSALGAHLPWLCRTSPPNAAQGLADVIAATRGVPAANVLPGAGSSDLIFLALTRWLTRRSTVLILDPTYSEYAHVLERVVGCHVDRFALDPATGYRVDPGRLVSVLGAGYDLVVLVNPNSPTGAHLDRASLTRVIASAPATTRFWIDETYIEYAGAAQSCEAFAAASANVVVCKSMSKVYALSGLRAAYLVAPRHVLEGLRAITPPWAVSLLAQVAAVAALQDPDYYAARYAETAVLRRALAAGLEQLGWDTVEGCANFVLAHLPSSGPTAAEVVVAARGAGVFVRDVGNMGQSFAGRAIRVAVKDAESQRRVLQVLALVARVRAA